MLSGAGLLAGLSVCVLSRSLNSKLYLFSGSLTAHFQESFGQISFCLLVLGGLISAGSAVLLFSGLAGQGKKANGGALVDLTRVLRECGIENVTDPLQSVRTSINQLRLELAEGKKRERAIIQKAVDVICVLDIQARFLTVSQACRNAWGYDPHELESRPLADLLVTENSSNILNSIFGSANSIDKIIFESKLKRKDGRLLDVVWTAHWSASDGGLFCIVHDISERKYAERMLKSSENRLRRTLEGLPVGVLMVDAGGRIEFANAEAARLVFRSNRELIGSSMDTLLIPADREAQAQMDALETPGSDTRRMMATARRKDGSSFPVDLSKSTIEISDEQKTIAVFLDKTAEQELERVKREFIAMVTHEIRTPISSVYGILALLEAGALGELTEKGRRLTGSVKITCKRIIGLINDLLDLEKIHAGKFKLEPKTVPVRHAMEIAYENVISLASERNITIELPDSELSCWADEDRLVQVLVNLISNSVKYSPDGSSIRLLIDSAENGFVKISVIDKGRGIPEDKLKKIFSQFEQVEIADAKKKGGTGLGLPICQAIVTEHGGTIGVESKLGEGACFWFTMPVDPPPSEEEK